MKCACGCTDRSESHATVQQMNTAMPTADAVASCSSGGCSAASNSSGTSLLGADDEDIGDSSGAATCSDSDSACGCGHDHGNEGMKTYEKVSLVAAGIFLAIALVGELLFDNHLVMLVASALSIVGGLVIVLPETFESLKAKSIDINVLLIVAIIGAVYVQAYEEAAAVLFLFSVGEYLEGRAMRKSTSAIEELAKLAPDTALVVRNGETIEVQTDQVALDETVRLKPGMTAPLDGIITKGSSTFNDAAITGESIPVYKTVGDKVFAASLAVDGSCEFTTTSTIANSTLAKISDMVQEAQQKKSERENYVQRFAKIYTPLVIVAALLVAFVPPAFTAIGLVQLGDIDTWIYRACELLVISCPCAFVISTPVTVVSALTRAAKLGVLVKGGLYFEEGAKVNVIAFDKTGTLTEGKPEVTQVMVFDEATEEHAIVEIAAALEQHSTHPLARALVVHAQQQGINDAQSAEDILETAGKGLTGSFQGERYTIGSYDYLVAETNLTESLITGSSRLEGVVGTVLYLARVGDDPVLLGALVLADAVRSDSKQTISSLQQAKQRLRTVMLTGDNEKTAQAVAAQVGVDEVHAALLPQNKTTELNRLAETYGQTAFVGDGINDAPSIATASVGIAMGGAGSDAALSSADVVLMADDISALPKFFNLSAKTVAILRQNVVLAIGLKVLVALLVVLGLAQMWMAVLADTGVSLLVIANGMRLLRVRL